GERFGYSGEGVDLLQLVVEEVTGEGLEEFTRSRVFTPLGMIHTSYVWQERFASNLAVPHDAYERPKRFRKRMEADAAGSMATTAQDYARLLCAILDGSSLDRATIEELLKPQITIRSQSMFGPGARIDEGGRHNGRLAWGLGWGRFDCEHGRAIFHTGHEGGTQNYNVTYVDKGIGVVFLSNSDNFESVARELAEAAIGDTCSPFDWLGYPRYDPNRSKVPPPEPVAIEVDRAILEPYAGTYELGGGKHIFVKFENGALLASSDDAEWMELFAETPTRFFIKGENIRIEFVVDPEGAANKLVLELEEGVTIRAVRAADGQ
ncbi:MAG: serine hydrolase, partial [Candidatus Latescibacterota bacterium]